jgi:hypothetical protein
MAHGAHQLSFFQQEAESYRRAKFSSETTQNQIPVIELGALSSVLLLSPPQLALA